MESSGKGLLLWHPPSILDLSQEIGHTQESAPIHFLQLLLAEEFLIEANNSFHSLRAAWPITLPHFSSMCFSQRWSLLHVSLRELQTAAMFDNPAGDSFPRMHSKANSGKSKIDISPDSSTLSTLWAHLFLGDIVGDDGAASFRALTGRNLSNKSSRAADNSRQNKMESSLTSPAHGGRGCKGSDLDSRTMTGKNDMRKKNGIRKPEPREQSFNAAPRFGWRLHTTPSGRSPRSKLRWNGEEKKMEVSMKWWGCFLFSASWSFFPPEPTDSSAPPAPDLSLSSPGRTQITELVRCVRDEEEGLQDCN